jgi:flagellar motility protein MotE (MotC chaperone)
MRLARELRLIPVVAIAAAALFVLKTSAIVIEGGYTLIASRTAQAQGLGAQGPGGQGARVPELPPATASDDTAPRIERPRERGAGAAANPSVSPAVNSSVNSWVRDLYTPPAQATEDITGSVAAPPKPEPPKDANATAPNADKNAPAVAPTPLDGPRPAMSAGERAVLESLQQRRQELETRAREIEVRDSLLKAAERRIEQRLQELKEMEGRLTGASAKKDEAEAAKFKSLVSMYENMKAKDAAKIFDRLDLRILVEVVNVMNPRRMADILGVMQPEAAERLTVELANRSGAVEKAPAAPAELPKIEGRPNRS